MVIFLYSGTKSRYAVEFMGRACRRIKLQAISLLSGTGTASEAFFAATNDFYEHLPALRFYLAKDWRKFTIFITSIYAFGNWQTKGPGHWLF